MWSHCRFKDGSRGFAVEVVGGFPNLSLALFTLKQSKNQTQILFH